MSIDLYHAIGGRTKINAAVELFYRKVLADASLRGFFAASNLDGLRAKQAMFLSMLLGGETRYSGRGVGEAHAQARTQGLADSHFDACLVHFRAALEEIGVAPDTVIQILQKVETTRGAVLGR